MAITYTFETEEDLLRAKSVGTGNDLDEVFDYAKAVITKAIESNSKKIFIDETKLSHDLGVLDTVMLAEKTKAAAPRVGRVAILYDKKELKQGDFYETVASNRGLIIFVTSDHKKALEWLK